MTIFIDDLAEWKAGHFSAHLGSDKDEKELHDFAQRLGLKRSWFQEADYPHYDVMGRLKYDQALALGAIHIPAREWLTKIPRKRPRHSPLPG